MRSLGQDGWKIASALMGRHIGGGNLADIYLFCKYMEKLDKKQTIGLFCAFPNFDQTQYANFGRYYVSERAGVFCRIAVVLREYVSCFSFEYSEAI